MSQTVQWRSAWDAEQPRPGLDGAAGRSIVSPIDQMDLVGTFQVPSWARTLRELTVRDGRSKRAQVLRGSDVKNF